MPEPDDEDRMVVPFEKKPERLFNWTGAGLITAVILGVALSAWVGVKVINLFFYMPEESRQHRGATFSGWKENAMEIHAAKVERDFEEAARLVALGKPLEGQELYDNSRASLKDILAKYGHKALPDRGTLNDWIRDQENRYALSISNTLPDIEAKLEAGEYPVHALAKFVRDLDYAGFDGFMEWFDVINQKLSIERSSDSTKWMRIVFEGSPGNYESLVKQAIRKRWKDHGHYQIIYGIPVTQKDRDATWKELVVRCVQKDTPVAATTPESILGRDLPLIPTEASIQFTMRRNPDIPTSWDDLPPFEARAGIPKMTLDNAQMLTAQSLATTMSEANALSLQHSISNKLNQLPEFELFPGFSPEASRLVVDGHLNEEHARPLAYRSPSALGSELSLAAIDATPTLAFEICSLIAQLQIEELAPILTDLAPQLGTQERRDVVMHLRNAPAFGNYNPILAIIRSSPADIYPETAMSALKKRLMMPRVRKLVEEKIRGSDPLVRRYYAAALFNEMPLEEMEAKADFWLSEENGDVGAEFFEAVMLHHPRYGEKLFGERFNESPGSVQRTMVRSVHLTLLNYTDAIGESLKQAALQNEDLQLKDLAYEELGRIADFEKGWWLLREIEESESDDRKRELAKIHLVRNLDLLPKEKALLFLQPQITCGLAEAESVAMNYFFSKNYRKTEVLEQIVDHLRSNPGTEFLENAVNAITRYRISSTNWKLEENAPLLREILGQAITIRDDLARKQVHLFLGELVKQGDRPSLEFLKLAKGVETNEALVKGLDRMIGEAGN